MKSLVILIKRESCLQKNNDRLTNVKTISFGTSSE